MRVTHTVSCLLRAIKEPRERQMQVSMSLGERETLNSFTCPSSTSLHQHSCLKPPPQKHTNTEARQSREPVLQIASDILLGTHNRLTLFLELPRVTLKSLHAPEEEYHACGRAFCNNLDKFKFLVWVTGSQLATQNYLRNY